MHSVTSIPGTLYPNAIPEARGPGTISCIILQTMCYERSLKWNFSGVMCPLLLVNTKAAGVLVQRGGGDAMVSGRIKTWVTFHH